MADLKWYGPRMIAAIRNQAAIRIEYAARATRDHLRTQLGRMRFPPAGPPGDYPALRTGHLRRNVQMEMDRARLEARVGTNVKYGRYLEFGTTRGLAPRPWLSRGFREMTGEILRILKTPAGGAV